MYGLRRDAHARAPSPSPPAPTPTPRPSQPSASTKTSIVKALNELGQILPPTPFKDSVIEGLRAAYEPGVGMAEAFGRWMEHVLGHRGLVVYDSSDPASKPLVSQVFARELANPGQTGKLAALAGTDLTARGYHAQVHTQDESLALFHLSDGRRPIRHQDGHFVVGDDSFAAAALLKQATEAPAGFSPNVLLRPVVQDTIFPTICYVAGPNELAYLGQLRGVYSHFGVPMPLMYPRASATLVDSAARALPEPLQDAARGAAGAGRSGAERPARSHRFRRSSKTRSTKRRAPSSRR